MLKHTLRISADCEVELTGPDDGAIKLARLLPAIGRIHIQAVGRPEPVLEQTVRKLRAVTRAPIDLAFHDPLPDTPPGPDLVWLQRLMVPGLDDTSLSALLEGAAAEEALAPLLARNNPLGTLKAAQGNLRGLERLLERGRFDEAVKRADRLVAQHPWLTPWLLERFAAHPQAAFGPGPAAPAPRSAEEARAAEESRPAVPAPRLPRPKPLDAPLVSGALPALGPHWIGNLAPQPVWDLVIDESGTNFKDPRGPSRGRLVGVLLPRNTPLEAIPGYHTRDRGPESRQARLQALTETPCGIIGVDLAGLAPAGGDRWTSGVAEIVAWTLRLLPIAERTRLHVHIENRSQYLAHGRWEALGALLTQGLAAVSPQRASYLDLRDPRVVAKDDPFVGYADLVAFLWHTGGVGPQSALAQAGLAPCLIQGDAFGLRTLFDGFDARRGPGTEEWRALLRHPEHTLEPGAGPPGLAAVLNTRLMDLARKSSSVWTRYLRAVLDDLDGLELDLAALRREVDWLDATRTGDKRLGARIQLAWALACLAEAVHHGDQHPAQLSQMAQLAPQVMQEDARLVCLADLYRAVHATNAFDFQGARAILQPWAERDPLILGARLRGRVLSSLGQHAAFEGDLTGAEAGFQAALAAFGQLSQPEDRAREAEQTGAYRAIVALDDPARSDAEVRALVEAVTGPLDRDLVPLTTGNRPRDKYALHLVLRLLVNRPGFAPEVEQVLALRDRWRHRDDGHPWPLIELYRALLLDGAGDFEGAKQQAVLGATVALAQAQGPVVQLIGACICAIATRWGVDWADREPQLAALAQALPRAQARIEAIRTFCATPDTADPRALLQAALPFNFR